MNVGSEQAKKPPKAEGDNGPSSIDQLMRDLGATRWDPTPVDQHDFFLDEVPGESALQRALAWMRAHTIRRGRWKAYAVDERGNELRIEHLAADLGWQVKWAQEVWRSGEGYGLFRRENQCPSRLYLNGKVIRLTSNLESNGCRGASRCTTASSPLILPGYLERQIAKWEPDRRAAFLAQLEGMEQWGREVEREAMAAARAIVEQRKDSLFAEFGLQKMLGAKRREPRKTALVTVTNQEEGQANPIAAAGAATNGASPTVVQPPPKPVVPPPATSIVQTPAETVVEGPLYTEIPASVQRSEAAVHRPQNGAQVTAGEADKPAEGSPSLKALETSREEADPSSSSSSGGGVGEGQGSTTTTDFRHETEENTGVERVALAIAKVTTPDDTLVRDLVAACRNVEPTATYEEIAHFVGMKVDQALSMRSVRNLPGFLKTAVPRCFEGVSLAAYRREARELAQAATKEQCRGDTEVEQFRQEQQAVLDDPGFDARTAVAARDGGSLGPCQHCSGRGYLLKTGTEQVAGEELRTIDASACDCSKGREIGYGRLAAIEREEAKRRGPAWIAAHRSSDHPANSAAQTWAASLRP